MYKIKLPDHVPDGSIVKDGYLARDGEILKYKRGEAVRRAKIFNGRVERC